MGTLQPAFFFVFHILFFHIFFLQCVSINDGLELVVYIHIIQGVDEFKGIYFENKTRMEVALPLPPRRRKTDTPDNGS